MEGSPCTRHWAGCSPGFVSMTLQAGVLVTPQLRGLGSGHVRRVAQATGEVITKQDGSTWESGPKRAEGREAGRRWGLRWEHWACPAEACGPEETGKYGWECSLYDRRVTLHRGTGMTWNNQFPKPSPSRSMEQRGPRANSHPPPPQAWREARSVCPKEAASCSPQGQPLT